MSSTRDFEVEEKLIPALRRRNGVATVGDVVAETGLSADEAEAGLRRMLSIYRSHLDVDDDGNLRYRFDTSFERYGDEPRRMWYKIVKAVRRASALLFKIWIVLMIVGYTAAFVLMLLAASLGMIGLSLAGGDEGGGGGLGELGFLPLYGMMRVLEFMFWISILDDRPGRGVMGRRMKKKRKKPEKPFYQKVFDYVFGPDESRPDPLEAQRFFAKLVREHDGVLTSADWSRYTGHSLERSRELLTACALRFRGAVDMNEEGTLVFRFSELSLSAADATASAAAGSQRGGKSRTQGGSRGGSRRRWAPAQAQPRPVIPIWKQEYKPAPLTGNKRSTNVWISILNGFNMSMGAYITFGVPATAATAAAVTALGWIPMTFSALLFAVPVIRRVRRGDAKKKAQQENEWRRLLADIYEVARRNGSLSVKAVPTRLQGRLMSELDAESETDENGAVSFRFPRLAAELAMAESARDALDPTTQVFGTSIFSSDDSSEAMNKKDAEEFDARLERELAR